MTKDIELKAVNQGTALATGALALCRTANRLGGRSKRRSAFGVREHLSSAARLAATSVCALILPCAGYAKVPGIELPGPKLGDPWCLCAPRWLEVKQPSHAPRVVLRAAHEAARAYCAFADLKRFAVDLA